MGWHVASELKISAGCIRSWQGSSPWEIVSTFLGAPRCPGRVSGKSGRGGVLHPAHREKLLPHVGEGRLAEFCDVFCDRGAFTVEQSKRGCRRAGNGDWRRECMRSSFEDGSGAASDSDAGGELRSSGAGDQRATSSAGKIGDGGDAAAGNAIFTWGWSNMRRRERSLARERLSALANGLQSRDESDAEYADDSVAGVHAIAHDAGRAIAAATVNAAYALRREKAIGSLEVGKQADIAVFEVADYREIPYYFGSEPLLDDCEAWSR